MTMRNNLKHNQPDAKYQAQALDKTKFWKWFNTKTEVNHKTKHELHKIWIIQVAQKQTRNRNRYPKLYNNQPLPHQTQTNAQNPAQGNSTEKQLPDNRYKYAYWCAILVQQNRYVLVVSIGINRCSYEERDEKSARPRNEKSTICTQINSNTPNKCEKQQLEHQVKACFYFSRCYVCRAMYGYQI